MNGYEALARAIKKYNEYKGWYDSKLKALQERQEELLKDIEDLEKSANKYSEEYVMVHMNRLKEEYEELLQRIEYIKKEVQQKIEDFIVEQKQKIQENIESYLKDKADVEASKADNLKDMLN